MKNFILIIILFHNTLFAYMSNDSWKLLINKSNMSNVEQRALREDSSDRDIYIVLSSVYAMQNNNTDVNISLQNALREGMTQDRFNNHLTRVKEIYPKFNKELTELSVKFNNMMNKAKIWNSFDIPNHEIYLWQKAGVETPSDARKWIDIGVVEPTFISKLIKIGIKTSKEYKPYSKLGYSNWGTIIGCQVQR